MHYLLLAILASVMVSILLKVAHQKKINIAQAIAFSYIIASLLCYFILKPELPHHIEQAIKNPSEGYLFLALGLLLPIGFIFMSKAVEYNGIVRTDVAQRLSLFLPIIAAFMLFGEQLSFSRVIGIILAFLALFCLMAKPQQLPMTNKKHGFYFLLLVWLTYGTADILFKQIAKLGAAFPLTLFIAFVLAGCLIFIYLFLSRTYWQFKNIATGLLLGVLNFSNILFYIKAHQTFSENPSFVFVGMNIGVICVATLIGAIYFKEKISSLNKIGLVLGILSILSLSYLSMILG